MRSNDIITLVLIILLFGGAALEMILRDRPPAPAPEPQAIAWEYATLYEEGGDLVFTAGDTHLRAPFASSAHLIDDLHAALGAECAYGQPHNLTGHAHVLTCLNQLGWQLDQYGQGEHGQRYILKRPRP